jgi:sugar phosphate isomerase/epimerase
MKLGLSSYCFRPLLGSGELSIEAMFDWVKEHGGEHIELATFSFAKLGSEAGYDLTADTETLDRIEAASKATGIVVSGICLGADFMGTDAAARRVQVETVQRHVELCHRFGAKFLRHDVVPWSHRLTGAAEFEREFPAIVAACREIADFATQLGITTSVEDHGFFMNSSARVARLIHAVARPNFRFTVDVGNFLCVDEDSLVGTRAGLPLASFVHLKDFYVRRTSPGPGWLNTLGGQYIRGSVFGFGDLPTQMIVDAVVASGYNGFISLEYEANEPVLAGCATSLDNIRRMFEIARTTRPTLSVV